MKQKPSLLILQGIFFISLEISSLSAQSCGENGYFADASQCDAYSECKDGVLEQHLCPEGLLFNDKLTGYPRYPCSYPQEVDCGRRTKRQSPEPTAECPHQYGMFRSDDGNCAVFKNCVAGHSILHSCPEGLAFNEENLQCDWPDQVPACDTSALFRFACPGVRVEADLGHPRYADPDDCRKFFVCVEGIKPRMHSCQVGFVFNPDLGVCDEPQNVPKCSNYYPTEILDAIQKLKSFDNTLL